MLEPTSKTHTSDEQERLLHHLIIHQRRRNPSAEILEVNQQSQTLISIQPRLLPLNISLPITSTHIHISIPISSYLQTLHSRYKTQHPTPSVTHETIIYLQMLSSNSTHHPTPATHTITPPKTFPFLTPQPQPRNPLFPFHYPHPHITPLSIHPVSKSTR